MTFEQIFQKAVNEKVKELKNEVIDALWAKSQEERRTIRSKTFPGIAKAMASQWESI